MAPERERTTEASRRTVQVDVAKTPAGETALITRGLDGWIEIAFRSAPNAAQVRSLHWLEDDGMLALERVDGHVRFPERAWLAAGEIPAESASIEETDEWQRRHDEIARLLGVTRQRVHVDVNGFFLGSDFRLTLVVDDAALPLEQTSPVFGEQVMLPAVYKAQVELERARSSWSRDGQVAALGRLKAQLTDAAQLLEASNAPLAVTFHPHVADVHVRPVKRAALAWRSTGNKGRLFSLELDEIRDDDSRERLPVEKLSAQAPVISLSAKEHLVLPDEMAEVARVAKHNRNRLERNVERDPTLLLPEGYSYDCIDLTAYSDRVLGFETLQGTDSASALPAGVAWYRKDADEQVPVVTLRVQDSGGVVHEQLVAHADVPGLLREARSALEHDGSVVIQGKRTPATAALVEQLEALAPPPVRAEGGTAMPQPPVAVEPSGQPRQQAAIIRERDGSGHTVTALPPVPITPETPTLPN